MTPLKPWPTPAGKQEAKHCAAAISKVAELEAQAKNLSLTMIADFASMLEATATHAGEMIGLNSIPMEVRQIAERVYQENTSRAASVRQMTREKPQEPDPDAEFSVPPSPAA